FWRENSGADRDLYGFKEATPHLVMAAFLQRVVNGGGRITREMAIGRKRLDICIEYGQGRYVVELKMKRQFGPDSLGQLAGYLADLGLEEGWMAVFDDDAAKSWDEKIFRRDETCNGKTIHIVGL
ncbi:MAG: ATP-binding protein, partial [Kiritimatiellae bacterium]|nr:ATP-binding protein [Kiritimatiellia bacterium]